MSSYTSQRFRPHRPHYTQFLHEWVSLNGKKQFPSGYLSVNNVTKCFPNNLKDPLLFSCSQNMWYQYKNTQRTKPAHSEACREISFTWLGWNVLGGVEQWPGSLNVSWLLSHSQKLSRSFFEHYFWPSIQWNFKVLYVMHGRKKDDADYRGNRQRWGDWRTTGMLRPSVHQSSLSGLVKISKLTDKVDKHRAEHYV